MLEAHRDMVGVLNIGYLHEGSVNGVAAYLPASKVKRDEVEA
jgi:hypothetical protein